MPSSAIIRKRRGIVLVMTLIFLAAISAASIILFERTSSNAHNASRRINDQEAIRIAEAGIEKAVWCLNNPPNTTDCPGNPNYGGENTITFGRGTYTSTVTGSGNSRTVDVVGTVSGTGGTSVKHIQAKLTTTTTEVSFQYGVQAGVGGIELGNNAFIAGNVYAGGDVIGTNGSHIDGDAILTPSNPTLDINSNPGVSPLNTVRFGDDNDTKYLAQSFIPSITERVFSFGLKMARHDDPSLNVTLFIYDDNANNPNSNLSGSGQAINVNFPTDAAGWENGFTTQIFAPDTNPVLQAGTKYWLVLQISQTNSSKYWLVARDTNGAAYADGTAKIEGGTAGMDDVCVGGCDIAMQVNVGGVPPLLKIPVVHGDAYSQTIEDTKIDGKAYYQSLAGTVKANLDTITCAEDNSGPWCFDNQPNQPPANFPISDAEIAQMEAQAATGGTTTCSPTCIIPDGASIGPRKYNGNVTLDNGAQVTLTGTVWVNGDLLIDNNSILRLSDAYGTDSGTIIADYVADQTLKGKILLQNNGNVLGNSTPDTYIMAISMHRDQVFSAATVNVLNNLSACVIYSPYGIVEISNNAALKEVTAQKLILRENTSVTYESGLANVNFTTGPGGSWVYRRGTYQVIE